MSTCDVCIGGGYDYDGSYDFFSTERVRARKPHRCEECHQIIPVGSVYERHSGKFDGDFYSGKACLLCAEIRDVFSCGDSYEYGTLWELMREIAFPQLTTASECFTELSAAAKARVLEEWRKWKGLA
jgi:hypothetical protein